MQVHRLGVWFVLCLLKTQKFIKLSKNTTLYIFISEGMGILWNVGKPILQTENISEMNTWKIIQF